MKLLQKSLLALVLAGALCSLTCCTLPGGGTDADSLVSDTVTAEEWAAVFDPQNFEEFYGNCTVVLTGTRTQKAPDGTTATLKGTQILVADGNKLYGKTKFVTSGELSEEDAALYAAQSGEFYAERLKYAPSSNGGEYIQYAKEDDVWTTEEIDFCSYDVYVTVSSIRHGGVYIHGFEDLEYSEEAKGYVIKNIEDEGIKAMILKFKDGKLAAVIEEGESEGAQFRQTMTFTYGGQTVTLPTVEEPTPPTVGSPDAE